MATIHSLSAELLSLIIDAYIPEDWNAFDGYEEYLDNRLVCKTFNTLISSHVFRKLDWGCLIENAHLLATETVGWLIQQGMMAEVQRNPADERFSCLRPLQNPIFNVDGVALLSGQRSFQAACTLAAAYQGGSAICEQLQYPDTLEVWQQSPSSMLAVAAYCGDEQAVASLVHQGHSVNSWDKCLGPALYAAVYNMKPVIARFLLECKADPNVGGILGTPLHVAVRNGDVDMVHLLLQDPDVDPNAMDGEAWTPLSSACRNGFEEIVELLLERDDVDLDLKFTLNQAMQNGYEEIVRMLLARQNTVREGAGDEDMDVDSEEENVIESALYDAIRFGCTHSLQLCLDHWHFCAGDYLIGGETLLYWAVHMGNHAALQVLLERSDIDPNTEGKNHITPLWQAARKGDDVMVGLLLERKDIYPDINHPHDGTPLYVAALYRHEGVVRRLLARSDVDPNSRNDHGLTPLWIAASQGQYDIVDLLLQRPDIDPNIQSDSGDTALWIAVCHGQINAVRVLMDSDAVDTNIKGRGDRSPLALAAEFRLTEIVSMILERPATDVNSIDAYGRTPAHIVSERGDEDTLRLLLQQADITLDNRDQWGYTPLIVAARRGHVKIAQLILEHQDATINMQDDCGDTCLVHAIRNNYPDVVQLLLDFNANVGVQDMRGLTALHWVKFQKNRAIESMLARHLKATRNRPC